MKLRELFELQDRIDTNNVIAIYEGENCHLFISEEDYENFDLDVFGDAEVLRFSVETVYGLPYLSITCQLEELPKQNMQKIADEFFDYLDECSNGAGPKMMF